MNIFKNIPLSWMGFLYILKYCVTSKQYSFYSDVQLRELNCCSKSLKVYLSASSILNQHRLLVICCFIDNKHVDITQPNPDNTKYTWTVHTRMNTVRFFFWVGSMLVYIILFCWGIFRSCLLPTFSFVSITYIFPIMKLYDFDLNKIQLKVNILGHKEVMMLYVDY